jgi:hypothetical protein
MGASRMETRMSLISLDSRESPRGPGLEVRLQTDPSDPASMDRPSWCTRLSHQPLRFALQFSRSVPNWAGLGLQHAACYPYLPKPPAREALLTAPHPARAVLSVLGPSISG